MVAVHANRRRLRRTGMLGRTAHATGRGTATGILELTAQMGNLFLVLLLDCYVPLLHVVNLLADQTHLLDLRLNLMFVRLAGPAQGLIFGAELVEELIEAISTSGRRHAAHSTVRRIHRHVCTGSRASFGLVCRVA
jgi:hypothetical protein